MPAIVQSIATTVSGRHRAQQVLRAGVTVGERLRKGGEAVEKLEGRLRERVEIAAEPHVHDGLHERMRPRGVVE